MKYLTGKDLVKNKLARLNEITGDAGIPLPNGCHLYWKINEVGGRTYYSDEVGGGVGVWDTCLVQDSTLLAALTQEAEFQYLEKFLARK